MINRARHVASLALVLLTGGIAMAQTPASSRTPSHTYTPYVSPTPTRTATPCANQALPSELRVEVEGTTVGMSDRFASPYCGGHLAGEKVYRYVAPRAGLYTFQVTGFDFDPVLYLRYGDCGGPDKFCDDDAGYDPNPRLEGVYLEPGAEIFIFVDGFGRSEGRFSLRILGPGMCAIEAPTLIDSVAGTTVGAEDGRSSACGSSYAPDRTYQFRAPTFGSYTFSTHGSSFDTVLSAWLPCGNLRIGCNDDLAADDPASSLTVTLATGQIALVTVDGYGQAAGDFRLAVTGPEVPECPDIDLGTNSPLEITSTTAGGIVFPGSSGCFPGTPARTFRYTAPADGRYHLAAQSGSTSMSITVRDGDCGGELVACGGGDVDVSLMAGQSVVVAVSGRTAPSTSNGDKFSLRIAPDESMFTPTATPTVTRVPCPQFEASADLPSTVTGTLFPSSSNVVAATCAATNGPENTIRFVAPTDGEYSFDTTGSIGNQVLYVFDHDCNGVEVACRRLRANAAPVRLNLEAGRAIVIVLESLDAQPDPLPKYSLHIARVGPLATPSFTPTPVATPSTTRTASPTPTATVPRCPSYDLGSVTHAEWSGEIFGLPQLEGSPCAEDNVGAASLRYTAPVTGWYEFDTGSSYLATALVVRDSQCDGVELGCDGATPRPGGGRLTLPLSAGQSVVAFVAAGREGGSFGLAVDRVTGPAATCTGDCRGTGSVGVDDVIRLVNIVLGQIDRSECERGLAIGEVASVSSIIAAVQHSLTGCQP